MRENERGVASIVAQAEGESKSQAVPEVDMHSTKPFSSSLAAAVKLLFSLGTGV
jgi:hypothetical protein